jgi:hypothetical protein
MDCLPSVLVGVCMITDYAVCDLNAPQEPVKGENFLLLKANVFKDLRRCAGLHE